MDAPDPADSPDGPWREPDAEEAAPAAPPRAPRIVPGGGSIRRELLDPDAVTVVRRLQRMGHEAYLVGGCVRDLLLGMEPKDFDVATDAAPNRIKRVFRNAFVIGRRFRLVHVRFEGGKVVETATFRRDPGEQGLHPDRHDGPIYDDNAFGTAAQDAFRRDFTVNALFYDPSADEVVDWVGGLDDLSSRTIRAIGDPDRRLREDPVRMIRAVHFAARLGGSIEPGLREAIVRRAEEIERASGSRLYIELLKVLARGCARPTLSALHELGVLRPWMPDLAQFLDRPIAWPDRSGGSHEEARLGEPEEVPGSHRTWNLLGAADAWGLAARGAPEALVLAVLFGPWLLDSWAHGPRRASHVFGHFEETFRPLALRMNVPRRTSWELREILGSQERLARPPAQPRRLRSVVLRPSFPEALAYFELDLRARDREDGPVRRWREVADGILGDRDLRGPRHPDAAPGSEEDVPAPWTDAEAPAPHDPDTAWEEPAPEPDAAGAEGFVADALDRPRRRRRGRAGRPARRRDEAGDGPPRGADPQPPPPSRPAAPAPPPPPPLPPPGDGRPRQDRPFGAGLLE